MNSLLILDARIVNEGGESHGDVFVKNGRIENIGSDLAGFEERAGRVVRAEGRLLLPGLIDDQVHFREPGLTEKADIRHESRAAVAGGVTSYMEMPNTKPPATTIEKLEEKYAIAAGKSLANYSFYLGAANDNLDEVRKLDTARVCGVKAFMGSSTGNLLVDDEAVLDRLFAEAPCIITTHCEDTPMIQANEAAFRERFGENVPPGRHPEIRSAEACLKSSSLAVELAKRHGARLHILHITTRDEMALFEPGPLDGKRVTAEACVHHLYFSDADYAEKGHLIKCNPAIKTAADRDAVRQGVLDGRIDVIATDHAPHTRAEKDNPYFSAPSGLPLVQFCLPALLELSREGVFPLPLIVEKTSHAVARMFDIMDRGYIREGYWADLVLVDPAGRTEVKAENIVSKCGWSPFEGHRFEARVDMTLVNGRIAYESGGIVEAGPGMRLDFDR